MKKQKHNKTYSGKATRRIKTKRMWLALAIAFTIGLSVIGIADTLTAKSIEPIISNEPVKIGYPIAEDKKDLTAEEQVRLIAKEEGFKWPEYLVRLMYCESSGNQYAIGVNKNGTKDLGLFQINDVHKLSNEFRFDISSSTKWTMAMINAGHQSAWTCDKKITKK